MINETETHSYIDDKNAIKFLRYIQNEKNYFLNQSKQAQDEYLQSLRDMNKLHNLPLNKFCEALQELKTRPLIQRFRANN